MILNNKSSNMNSVVGNSFASLQLMKQIESWKKGTAIIVSGPPGCGKSFALENIASRIDYEIVTGSIEELRLSSTQNPFWKRGKILVFDLDGAEIDGLDELLQMSIWPIIFMTTDIYHRSLQSIRKDPRTIIINFSKIPTTSITNILRKICLENKISISDGLIYKVARMADGDMRFAKNVLFEISYHSGNIDIEGMSKDPVQSIFEQLESLFQHSAVNADEEIMPWLAENISERYSNPQQRAVAYRCIADADRFSKLGLSYANDFIRLIPVSRLGSRRFRIPSFVGGKK